MDPMDRAIFDLRKHRHCVMSDFGGQITDRLSLTGIHPDQ